jgi:ABC-type antimicrobial peptide transport system permease subunit
MFRAQNSEGRIIGVIKDFHAGTLKGPLRPMFFRYMSGFFGLTVRIDPRNTAAALQHIAGVMKTFLPEEPFTYEFLDDILRRMYDADRLDARIVAIFGVIAVLIACLGLFGLISFAAEQRTKEIGVRKVLGASIGRIVRMMAADFAGLVALGVVIAGPIWYGIARQWLASYAYRIRLDLWIFAAAGLLVFGLTLGAITLRAVRAAAGNPVEALRYE